MFPIELTYLLVAIVVGGLLYRYFTGHGGVELVRSDYGGLPAEGRVTVRHHEVRWSAKDDDSFAAAWQLGNGHLVGIRVRFDEHDEEAPERGRLELSVDRRTKASGVAWTDKIHDRALRSDVEAVLKTLVREARKARSDGARVAAARPVGDERKP